MPGTSFRPMAFLISTGEWAGLEGKGALASMVAAEAPRAVLPGSTYPAECYLPVHTVRYDGERVIDFSNPKTIQLEHDRAFQWVAGHEGETGRAEMDFADWWDKWPGQFDPYMSP